MGPFPSKASAVLLPPLPLRLLPAGATVAGWELHPLKIAALTRRTNAIHFRAGCCEIVPLILSVYGTHIKLTSYLGRRPR
jgi:hypothetical protein